MQQKSRRKPVSSAPVASRRPSQDAAMAQQANQFPTVGMTLNSYQQDGQQRQRRSPGTTVKVGRLKRFRQGITLKRSVLVLALLVVLIVGWVGGKFIYNAQKLFGGNIFGVLSSTKLKGEDQGRVNILMAGNSADDVGHRGGSLTDSIMLISLDTKHNKAFMLSIPRDLWVKIPGDGHQKINGVYVSGEAYKFNEPGYPEGGMGQLAQVVSESLDMPIHYHALVNYTGFRQAVDAVGGVDVTIKSTDPRGLYDPNIDWSTRGPLVKLKNGRHHLDGRQALNLARARGDSYYSYGYGKGDFTRAEYQRQMIVALKNKAVTAGVLANPAKLSSLADAIGNNVKTDFQISEVRRLYDLSKKIESKNIQSLSLDKGDNNQSLLASYATPQGQSALIPAAGVDDFSAIQAFIRRKTSSDPVVQEAAKLVVLNGTNTNGLAAKLQNQLKTRHMLVDAIGDAGNSVQVTTAIIDLSNGQKPATATALGKLFGKHFTTQNPYGNQYEADYIIILGKDQASTNQTNNGT